MTSRPRIPEHLRIPRPMSAGQEPRRLAWLGIDAAAIAAGVLIAAMAPLAELDAAARGFLLEALAGRDPSGRVLLVVAAPEDLRAGDCERSLRDLLDRGAARGALMLPPADAFCARDAPRGPEPRAVQSGPATTPAAMRLPPVPHRGRGGEVLKEVAKVEAPKTDANADQRARAPGPPVVRLPLELLRLRGGEVVGFEAPPDAGDTERAGALRALGIAAAPWVLPKAPRSVPAITLHDLTDGRLPPSVLKDRVVLVASGTGGPAPANAAGPAAAALQPAQSAAASLGGLLDQGRRAETPRWVAPLLIFFAGLLVRVAARRSGQLTAAIALAALTALLVGGQVLAAVRFEESLLPIASALLGLGVVAAGAALDRSLRHQRAVDSAAELIQRSALFKMQGVHTLPDEEFWPRVARLAAQAHPADTVIVADLPPRGWHLHFWNDRQGGESLIAERRRDIRRVPYSNEQGVPTIHVTRDFLTRQGMPAVVVPLIAFGEVEGYVFLCGDTAEAAFSREPERAERLGREFALLVRRKRLGRIAEPEPAPGAGGRELAEGIVEGARIALGDLQLFGAMLRTAPVGLLYADAFGDVRFLSRELAAWLRDLEVTVPPEGPNASLPPGSLTLGDVLVAAEETSGVPSARRGWSPAWLSSVMASEEGIEIPVEGPQKGVLHVRPLRQEADGLSWIAGYVAALVPAERMAAKSNVRAIGGRDSGDPLSAFALGEVVAEAVAAAAKATGRPLRLEPIRGAAYAIGHRTQLSHALAALLTDVAERGLPGHGPVISVRESAHGAQLSILDVGFGLGLPESALQRVLMAPTAAPPGLEPLGRMIAAVEDSHGEAELKTNDGWGITLVVTLLRAHPRLLAPAPDSGRAMAQNVVALNRK